MQMMTRIFLLCCSLFSLAVSYADEARSPFISNPEVKIFINTMVKKYHFKEDELISLFNKVKVRPKIIQSLKSPLEIKPWYTYKNLFITNKRITQGIEFWNKYQEALTKAEKMYGVPASIIVATIGVESKYGQDTGDYPVIDALVNLAFGDTTRTPFFRQELVEFLLLTRERHLDPATVMGSYAGAIGQPQFMPSSYRYYAVNFAGNDTIDLSHNEIDVIGSIANYYQKHGWASNEPVAVPASIAGGKFQTSLTRLRTISFSELIQAEMIPESLYLRDPQLKMLVLRGNYKNEYWLLCHNFDVIKRYNPSDLYAMAVYQLSYYIQSARDMLPHE